MLMAVMASSSGRLSRWTAMLTTPLRHMIGAMRMRFLNAVPPANTQLQVARPVRRPRRRNVAAERHPMTRRSECLRECMVPPLPPPPPRPRSPPPRPILFGPRPRPQYIPDSGLPPDYGPMPFSPATRARIRANDAIRPRIVLTPPPPPPRTTPPPVRPSLGQLMVVRLPSNVRLGPCSGPAVSLSRLTGVSIRDMPGLLDDLSEEVEVEKSLREPAAPHIE